MSRKEQSMRTLTLALRIADHACRSEIECYAQGAKVGDGFVYDLRLPLGILPGDTEGEAFALARAQDAADYIRLRQDDLDSLDGWRMVDVDGNRNRVRFQKVQS